MEQDSLSFRIFQANGEHIVVNVPKGASVHDLFKAVGAECGLHLNTFVLLLAGQDAPLPKSSASVEESVGGIHDLQLLVLGRVHLGHGRKNYPEFTILEDAIFQHYPALAFDSREEHDSSQSRAELDFETISGVKFTSQRNSWTGVIFDRVSSHSDSPACPPLSGQVLIRAEQHSRSWALGIGVGTSELDIGDDPEHSEHFFGLYHGGGSGFQGASNCCAAACRYHQSDKEWFDGVQLALLVDIENRTMQCYIGTEKFRELFSELPDSPLWPTIISHRASDCVSLSVDLVC